ncbi:MAG: hypothetical protein KGY76_08410, partial [Candidatus Thermoplasmatota archaeon]|nr:hypothetical protein [Candidatus Thermoplasmatota archaeon]
LKLARKIEGEEGDGWTVKRVDTDHRVGKYTSLKVGEKAEVHISYFDETHGDLRYARVFLEDRTPLPVRSLNTTSEYGKVILDWERPVFDGISDGKESILGYNIYRKKKGSGDKKDFELIEENLSDKSYTDDIDGKDELDTYIYKIAGINRIGIGDNSTEIRTKGRYFTYKRKGPKTNRYKIPEVLKIGEDDRTGLYDIRWDLDYNSSEEENWNSFDEKNPIYRYDEIGLKSVILEIKNSDGTIRRYLQSAWVVGEYHLNSTYEIRGSNEVFFHLPKDKSDFDNIGDKDVLKNKYILDTPKDLPYRYIDFYFAGPDETYSMGTDKKNEEVDPNSTRGENRSLWNYTIPVSHAEKDTIVSGRPYLYNEYREENQCPFQRDKDVEIIKTPTWFPYFLDLVSKSEDLSIDNIESEGSYHGWAVTFRPPSISGDSLDIASKDSSGINKLNKFFGGKYGFSMNVFPEETLTFQNDMDGVGLETTIIEFQTDVDNDYGGELDGDLGKGEYYGETTFRPYASITIDLVIDLVEREIRVEGSLGVGIEAGIKIDIPLYSIGIADVGLTAEVGADLGVEFDVGSISYGPDEGLTPEPGDSTIPVDLGVEFGGGPYGEVGAGLARVEGKFMLDLGVGIEIPTYERELSLGGRFEVVAEALWGAWEKSKSWSLYSTSNGLAALHDFTEKDQFEKEIFSTDRVSTHRYSFQEGEQVHPKFPLKSLNGVTTLEENIGSDPSPQIVMVNQSYGMAIWSELSKVSGQKGVQSDIYMREFSGENWEEKRSVTETSDKMEYDPRAVRFTDSEGNEKIALVHMEVYKRLNSSTAGKDFFENNSLRIQIYSLDDKSWSQLALNHSVDERSITSYDTSEVINDDIYIVYRAGNASIDIFNSSGPEEGSVEVLKVNLTNGALDKLLELKEEKLPHTSTPSIAFANSTGAISYIRTNKTSSGDDNPYRNETIITQLKGGEVNTIRETSNMTAYNILSSENGKLVASWVENRTSIRRKEINVNSEAWQVSDIESVYSKRTISSLKYHKNDTDNFYAFQSGERAVPTILQSKEDGWGYLRRLSREESYTQNQIDYDFKSEEPKMVSVKEDELIEPLHSAHYTFDKSLGVEVEDRSDEENTGFLRGNCTRIKHRDEIDLNSTFIDMREYERYIRFEDEDDEMMVEHSSSLNVTKNSEDFSITTLLRLERLEEGDLIKKDGSWAVRYRDDALEVELWREERKEVVTLENLDLKAEEWFFLGIRYEDRNSNTFLNVTLRDKNETEEDIIDYHTHTFELKELGALNSSSDPLILGGYPGSLHLDDFRLVEIYLPDAALRKINFTAYPSFDPKRSLVTQPVPPYANFTCSKPRVVGEPITFQGHSPASGLNWTWIFEDGSKRYGKNIEHMFQDTGYQTVKLDAAHKESGAVAYYQETLHIIATDPPEFSGIEDFSVLEGNSVRLDWNHAEGPLKPFEYHVHYIEDKKDEEDFDHRYWIKSTEDNFTVLRDLDPTVTHHVKVTVRNSLGLKNSSTKEISFTIDDTVPPKFEGLNSVYTLDHPEGLINLRWNSAFDHSRPITYNIYRSRTKNMSFEEPVRRIKDESKRISERMNVSDLGPYYFAVRAEDAEGNIDENKLIRRTFVNDTRPPEVDITGPLESGKVYPPVTLVWNSSDDLSGISRFWVKSDHHDWTRVGKDTTSYTFEDMPGPERTLTVKAVDGANNTATDSIRVKVGRNGIPSLDLLSPEDGREVFGNNVTLKVDVADPDDESLVVEFFDGFGTEEVLLSSFEEVSSGSEISYNWANLSPDRTYEWYVRVSDGKDEIISVTRSFRTVSEVNTPDEPKDPDPEDGEKNISLSPILSVEVTHPDEKDLDVFFYNATGESEKLIGVKKNVSSGQTASIEWKGLLKNKTYRWYAVADDGDSNETSKVWSFKTLKTLLELEVTDFEVAPIYGKVPLGVSIGGKVKNFGIVRSEIDLEIMKENSEKIAGWNYSVGPNEIKEIGESYQFDEVGKYTVTLRCGKEVKQERVTVVEEMGLKPYELLVPEELMKGSKTQINATLENLRESEEQAYIYVDGMKVHTEKIRAGEKESFETKYTFNETGDIPVEVRDQRNDPLLRERVSVLEDKKEALPEKPKDPRPKNDAEDISIDPTLNVDVIHPEGDDITVYFYRFMDEEKDFLLGAKEVIGGNGTASIEWNHLEKNTSYRWYTVASDGSYQNESKTWSFKTSSTGANNPPEQPFLVSPENGSHLKDRNATLKVRVSDRDGDSLNVTFYDVDNKEKIGKTRTDVKAGSTVEVNWSGLEFGKTYNWYVVVEDGGDNTSSPTWSFTVREDKEEDDNGDETGGEDSTSSLGKAMPPIQILLLALFSGLIITGLIVWKKTEQGESGEE